MVIVEDFTGTVLPTIVFTVATKIRDMLKERFYKPFEL